MQNGKNIIDLSLDEQFHASAGNRTRGWPNQLRTRRPRLATANFTTKPPMLNDMGGDTKIILAT
jgi:hypothetical protein